MKYEKYKDSGIKWIGEIPERWEVIKFKYFADLFIGNSIPDEDKKNFELVEEGIPYIATKDVKADYSVDYENGMYIPANSSNFKIATERSALMCIEGGSAGIKKCFLERNVCFGNKLCCFRPTAKYVNARYMYYFIMSPTYERYFHLNLSGLIGGVSIQNLKNFESIIPPINEQEIIASYLDDKTSKIDAIIKSLEEQRDKLEQYKRELISETVTKGLDKNVPMKNSGTDWIGQIPEHWKIYPLFYLFEQNKDKNNGMKNSNLLSLSYGSIVRKDIDTTFGLLPASFEGYQVVDNGYIILRLTDLQNDKRSLRTGLVREKGIITSAYVGLKKSLKDLNSEYLHYVLHTYDLKKVFYSMGSGLRQSLNFSDIKRVPLLFPPLEEQLEIVGYLNRQQVKIDSIMRKIDLQIEELREYRKIIIHEVVTGKRKVVGGAE